MKKVKLTLLAACSLFVISARAQHKMDMPDVTATPPKVIFSKVLNTASLNNQEFKLVVVNFAPGESSSAHRHPIPTFGYVLEGELESTFEGKKYRYKKGEAFYEEPNGLHNGTRNVSKTKPAKLLAMFIGDNGKPFLVPEKK
ncbi:cupin domain-containing protein [Mucilaginibacter conchicola]|uniref:Cupin domain-containing protein n=1 Tax=Mucilaginibacter conchicola TaxID=2303333 RepID=A0A372NQF1_9SPHI|nr:cupin domain-containing protein [Mucilaginibacter conchicola]RFZ91152.1 cupin domain-containing protein [Mucilaginibacter conchicola]